MQLLPEATSDSYAARRVSPGSADVHETMNQSHVTQAKWIISNLAVSAVISLALACTGCAVSSHALPSQPVIQANGVVSVIDQLFSALQQDALGAAIAASKNQFPGNQCPTQLPGSVVPLQQYGVWLSQVASQIAPGSAPTPSNAITVASTAAATDLAPFAQDWVPFPSNSTDVNAQRGAAAIEAKVAERLTGELSGAWNGLVSAFSNQSADVNAAAVKYLSTGPMAPTCVTVFP
jgi:hypothetical protein